MTSATRSPRETGLTRRPRLGGIEGLRALAALSVVIFHCSQVYATPDRPLYGILAFALKPLQLGVTMFFVLSGFLLYRPFAAAILRGSALPGIWRYARSRVLRIIPAYWFVLFCTALLFDVAVLGASTSRVGALHDPATLLADAVLAQGYLPSTIWTGVGPAWSLAVEAAFYAVLPLASLVAYATAARIRPGNRMLAVLLPVAALEVIGVVGKVLAVYVFPGPIGVFAPSVHTIIERGFPGQADGFAWGMLVAVAFVLVEDGALAPPGRTVRLALEACGVAAIGVLYLTVPAMITVAFPMPFAVILGFVVLAQARGQRPSYVAALEHRGWIALGVCSYSIFLWNQPVLLWMGGHGLVTAGTAGFLVTLAVLLVITVALAALTYRCVESPALRLARRPPGRAAVSPPAEAFARAPAG